MNNNTFTGIGATAFFDRYPVTDLLPVKDVIPPGRFARAKAHVLQQPAPMPTVRERLVLGFNPQAHGGPATDADLRVVDQDHRIQYFDIMAPSGQGAFHTLTAPQCPANSRMPVTFKLRTRPRHTSIALYYLPYDLNQHRRMTLADKQGIHSVNFFMTDIVDGCSVYVEGTSAHPTVSHLNANSAHAPGLDALPLKSDPVNLKADWKHKATQMHNRHAAVPAPSRVAANNPGLQAARRVDYKHYGMRFATDEGAFEGTLGALQANGRVPVAIGGSAVTTMQVVHAAGTIYGFRNLANWVFYVQRRALVDLSGAGGALGRQWVVRDVQAFWPAAGAVTGKAA